MFKILWCLQATISVISSRSYAVSNVACQNMTPIHGSFEPQFSVAKVQVMPHAVKIKRGQLIKVSLLSLSSDSTFRGFLVQARAVQSNMIVGNFLASDESKVIACGNSYSTASHSNPSLKSTQVLSWKAPTDFRGYIKFQ